MRRKRRRKRGNASQRMEQLDRVHFLFSQDRPYLPLRTRTVGTQAYEKKAKAVPKTPVPTLYRYQPQNVMGETVVVQGIAIPPEWDGRKLYSLFFGVWVSVRFVSIWIIEFLVARQRRRFRRNLVQTRAEELETLTRTFWKGG